LVANDVKISINKKKSLHITSINEMQFKESELVSSLPEKELGWACELMG